MAIAPVVMVLVMSVVSLHMHHHKHGLGAVSLVMMAHTFGMFKLSVVNGVLANRLARLCPFGRRILHCCQYDVLLSPIFAALGRETAQSL